MPAAKSSLLEAVSLEPRNPQYLQKLGAVLLASKSVDEAIQYLERAAALDPNSLPDKLLVRASLAAQRRTTKGFDIHQQVSGTEAA